MNRFRHLRDEQGFAMLVVMVLMLVGGAFVAAALAAADNDQDSSRHAQDRKAAYAAAEAGIEYYKFHLADDNDYWTNCTNVPAPSALNDEWNPAASATDTRTRWRTVPGTSAEYAVELLPASGTRCDPTSTVTAQTSMLDGAGMFRIRSTGRANGVKRSIVATFRRPSFLDYIYFTDFEVLDPWVGNDSSACEAYRPARAGKGCTEISFGGGDKILGPLHTNDSVSVASAVTFGKNASDPIEIALDKPQTINGSASSVTWVGTLRSPWDKLPVPSSNSELATVASKSGGLTLTGLNTVRLDAATDTIKVWKGMRPDQTVDKNPTNTYGWPSKGVLYNKGGTGGCSGTDKPSVADYFNDGVGCAQIFLSGTYDRPLTIGSAADIIVAPSSWKEGDPSKSTSADLTNTGDAVLGLIADGFVRVWHPVTGCSNRQPEQTNVTIHAAILGLHSFIVDNWGCGQLGTLNVHGAIAQKFRGPVATSGGTGYIKNYTYDTRLKYRNPPFFLTPVDVAWKVVTQREQVPAT